MRILGPFDIRVVVIRDILHLPSDPPLRKNLGERHLLLVLGEQGVADLVKSLDPLLDHLLLLLDVHHGRLRLLGLFSRGSPVLRLNGLVYLDTLLCRHIDGVVLALEVAHLGLDDAQHVAHIRPCGHLAVYLVGSEDGFRDVDVVEGEGFFLLLFRVPQVEADLVFLLHVGV